MTDDHQQLFALTRSGPVRLAVPEGTGDPAGVYDLLPRGIYEALRTFDHVRFVGLQEHLDRAQRSMAIFGIGTPLDREGLRRALHAIVSDFPAADTRVRIDLLAGEAAALGSTEWVLIQAAPLVLPSAATYRDGVRVRLVEGLRRRRPELKDAQWVVDRRAAPSGTPDNYEPILVDDGGRLLEGIMSNFFAVRGGELRTAQVDGVLAGVTRRFVMDLARDLGVAVREEAITRGELHDVDEAFFSTSVRSVVPIVGIADATLGDGRPGPITRQLMQAYADYCAREARPAWEESGS